MKTIGTLEEIGAQVGDVVEWLDDGARVNEYCELPITKIERGNYYRVEGVPLAKNDMWRIVTRAAKSPVRTVTRKEIVPGIYGKVTVTKTMSAFGCCGIQLYDDMSESDLTAAIATLTEIRDAMAGEK